MEVITLHPRLAFSCSMTQESSCCRCVCPSCSSAQSNTSWRVAVPAAADSSEKIHWALVLICEPGLCPGISFPPSGDSQTTLGSAAAALREWHWWVDLLTMLDETLPQLYLWAYKVQICFFYDKMIWFQDKCMPSKRKVKSGKVLVFGNMLSPVFLICSFFTFKDFILIVTN